jgi:hypothetical protein
MPASVDVVAAAHDVDKTELIKLSWAASNLWQKCQQFFPEPEAEVELCTVLDVPVGDGTAIDLEITGHADIISLPGDGSIRVGDWKSGWREGDYGAQLKTYAMLAYERFASTSEAAIDRVIVSILWLREGVIDSETFTLDQLQAWQETLVIAGSEALRGVLRIGEQCHYCPVSRCPQLHNQAGLFVMAKESGESFEITPDNAAELYFVAQALGKRVEDVKMAIKQFVFGGGPILTDTGKVLDLRPMNRETIALTPESAKVMQTQLSEDQMFAVCDINKTRLLETVKSAAPRGEKTAAANAMMEDLRAVGAVTLSVSQSLALVKPLEELE